MTLMLQPAQVATGIDEEGCLVFSNGSLVAVLVRLSGLHGNAAGHWFLEAGFGPLADPGQSIFVDLDEAQTWITRRLGARARDRKAQGAQEPG
jgi:hypothetical protein